MTNGIDTEFIQTQKPQDSKPFSYGEVEETDGTVPVKERFERIDLLLLVIRNPEVEVFTFDLTFDASAVGAENLRGALKVAPLLSD